MDEPVCRRGVTIGDSFPANAARPAEIESAKQSSGVALASRVGGGLIKYSVCVLD